MTHNLNVLGLWPQSNNIEKHPSHFYFFFNCLSRNLLLITLIIITLFCRKSYEKFSKQLNVTLKQNLLVSTNQNPIIMWYDNTKVNCSIWLQSLVKWRAKIIGKEVYLVLLADGRDFVYLVLIFIQLIFFHVVW